MRVGCHHRARGRALAGGGCLALVAFHVDQWRETGKVSRFAYDEDRLRAALERAGFSVEALEVEQSVQRFQSLEEALAAAVGLGRALARRRALVPLHRVPGVGRADADPQPSHREGAPVMMAAAALTEAIKARALALGFDLAAVGPADPPEHADSFRRWVEAGHAGTMAYLERRLPERIDPRRVLADARSVVTVALNYFQGEAEDVVVEAGGPLCLGPRLPRRDDAAARGLGPRFIGEAAGAGGKCYVDTGPLLERDLAARAGLGWVGKNTMLLNPALGSWFFIGVILTTAALVHGQPLPDRCGTCRACLDACPTDAFAAPYVLDARRCISYLTIEHRGDIEPALAAKMGDWQFGCDVRQDVCPWNRRAPVTREPAFRPSRGVSGSRRGGRHGRRDVPGALRRHAADRGRRPGACGAMPRSPLGNTGPGPAAAPPADLK